MNKLILASVLSLSGLLALPVDAQSGVLGLRASAELESELDARESDIERAQVRQEHREQQRSVRRDTLAPTDYRHDDEVPAGATVAASGELRVEGSAPLGRIQHSDRGDRDDRYDGDGRRGDNRWDGRHDSHGDNRWDGRHDSRHDSRWDNRWDNRWDGRREHHYDRRHDRDHRRADRRYWAQHRYRSPVRYSYPHGYNHWDFRIGYRLPPAYYSRHYYIDYRYYDLPPPPRGYQWVRVNDDVLLIALGSGLIRDILYGLFY